MRRCPTCDSLGNDYVQFGFWAEYTFDLAWCPNCELGWVRNLPDGNVFADAYERWNVLSWKEKPEDDVAKDIRRAYLKGARVAGQYASYRRGGLPPKESLQVLEVGSNIGAVLKGVTDRLGLKSKQVLGIDFSSNHAEVAKQKFGFDTVISTLEEAMPKIDRRFDLILAHHIIEHDEDPARFVRSLKSLLKPGGVLSFELPNGRREAECMLHDARAGLKPYSVINHINFFSPRGFEKLLRSSGLEILHLCSLNANRVMHDFGMSRRSRSGATAAPSLEATPKGSVVQAFSSSAVARGIARARTPAKIIRLTHGLRLHYPPSMPLGRDIEAYAQA